MSVSLRPRFGAHEVRRIIGRMWRAVSLRSPARIAIAVFLLAIAITTLLLKLDIATSDAGSASWYDALFVATSAVCVTGLTTVETATYWSTFGHVVIACAIKVGGLGVLTLAGLLILMVSRKLDLQQRLMTAKEYKSNRLGDVRKLLVFVGCVSVITELIIATILFGRFLRMGEDLGTAAWHGLFYAISSYNNAGFILHQGSLPGNAGTDWWLATPIFIGVLVGSLGTAVHMDLFRKHPRSWSLHTSLTLWMTFILWLLGAVLIWLIEHKSENFLGMPRHGQVLVSSFASLMPRSGGFTLIPLDSMDEANWWLMEGLMFVGGGTGSTAGGIKVTTLAVLILAAWSEARGDADIVVRRRRIPMATIRIAVAVVLAGATAIWIGTLMLIAMTGFPLESALFEVTSAFATVGLSTGITGTLPDNAKVLISVMMFIGRVGLLTLGAAMALQVRTKLIRYPEERPNVG